jgi:hypothetical protein
MAFDDALAERESEAGAEAIRTPNGRLATTQGTAPTILTDEST